LRDRARMSAGLVIEPRSILAKTMSEFVRSARAL
jgi:hypothetical protein